MSNTNTAVETAPDRSNFPTLEAKRPITAQQLVNFLQQAGLEITAPKPNHGLDKQFRLELAASYLNTFLLWDGEKKEEAVRASQEADKAFFANPNEETRAAMLKANAVMLNAVYA